MLISHKYQFIFIKTRKTAGTSVEISLSRYAGDQDVLTPISPADEKIRKQFGKQAQNQGDFYNHIGASEIKKMVGEEIWNSYYKFCFDRNPWDKVISFYYYTCNPNKVSFASFIESGRYKTAYNYPLYTINDEVAVDYMGKYETLDKDLETICKNAGIPYDGWLPKAKGNFRKDNRHYHDIYTQEQKEIVQQYYKKEIALLGYEF